jgi:hypothetical protein
MKRLLTLTVLLLCVITAGVQAQNSTSSASNKTGTKQTQRGRGVGAGRHLARAQLKSRGFYSGEQVGKLDDATREGLRKYQQAEGLKVTAP